MTTSMNFIIWSFVIATLAMFMGWLVVRSWKRFRTYLANKAHIDPVKSKNKAKEEKLLTEILTDIRDNTTDWFLEAAVVDGPNTIICNHKKNIGIQYTAQQTAVRVHLNLRQEKDFSLKDNDSLVAEIIGPHAKEFVIKAEQYIDRRGKELDFFYSRLRERI